MGYAIEGFRKIEEDTISLKVTVHIGMQLGC